MKTKYFHAVYFTIILIVSILYFQKNNQLKEYEAVIERNKKMVKIDNVMTEFSVGHLWNDARRYPCPNIADTFSKRIATIESMEDSLKKQMELFSKDKQISQLNDFKQNLHYYLQNIKSNDSILDKSLTIPKILADESYWHQLPNLPNNLLDIELSYLENRLLIDKFMCLHTLLNSRTCDAYYATYRISPIFFPTTLTQGDTLRFIFEVEKVLKFIDLNNVVLKIDNQLIKPKNGRYYFEKVVNQKGKYHIDLRAVVTDPFHDIFHPEKEETGWQLRIRSFAQVSA